MIPNHAEIVRDVLLRILESERIYNEEQAAINRDFQEKDPDAVTDDLAFQIDQSQLVDHSATDFYNEQELMCVALCTDGSVLNWSDHGALDATEAGVYISIENPDIGRRLLWDERKSCWGCYVRDAVGVWWKVSPS